jgi:circadian clock protein KaiC
MNLVSGATGSGKTVFSMQFVNKGEELGQNCLYITYEDVPVDLKRNAESLGLKGIARGEKSGNLKIVDFNVESIRFHEHIAELIKVIKSFKPQRLVVDSLSALHPSLKDAEVNLLVRTIRAMSKEFDITTVCTNIVSLIGSTAATEARLSSYFDSIILFRHVELESEMRRSVIALKMRGSQHASDIRQFMILSGHGIKIGEKFEGVENILLGSARRAQRLKEFEERKNFKAPARQRNIETRHLFDSVQAETYSRKKAR